MNIWSKQNWSYHFKKQYEELYINDKGISYYYGNLFDFGLSYFLWDIFSCVRTLYSDDVEYGGPVKNEKKFL